MAVCFPHQIPKLKLTPEVTRVIWDHAKDKIDAAQIEPGRTRLDFDSIIEQTANDLGMHPQHVAQAFTEPKAMRKITNEIYTKQAQRRQAIWHAKTYLADLGTPGASSILKPLYSHPFRRYLTTGHYVVFPRSHAGEFRFTPERWKSFFNGSVATWKFASKRAWGQAMADMQRHPLYTMALRGGLDIDVNKGPVGILYGKGDAGQISFRGWSGLKVMRMSEFEREWNRISPEDQTLDMAKAISRDINHATGTLSSDEWSGGGLGNLMFAPKLTASKWKRMTSDPAQTFKTIYQMTKRGITGKGDPVPAADRHLAMMRLRYATQYLAFRTSMLAANAGYLAYIGSKQKINWSNPLSPKSDWMKFKGLGQVFNFGGIEQEMQLLGKVVSLGYVFASGEKKKSFTPAQEFQGDIGKYAQYKLDPDYQALFEGWTGKDLFGRPLPWSKDEGSEKYPKYTWKEYGLEKGPIPLGGAAREIYDQMRSEGVSAVDTTMILKGLAAFANEVSPVGGSAYPDPDLKEKR